MTSLPRRTLSGLSARAGRSFATPLLLLAGGLTADASSLSLYKSLHMSDVLLITAGVVAFTIGSPSRRWAVDGLAWRRRGFLVVALLAFAYLVGTGVSTALAGAPSSGIETWLLFALFFGAVCPATALAVASDARGGVALAVGLVAGASANAVAFLVKAIDAGDAIFYGKRPTGVFGTDPFILMLVALAILCTHVTASFVQRRDGGRTWAMLATEVVAGGVLVMALLASRYRASWVAAAVAFVLVVATVTRSVRAVVLSLGAAALIGVGVYASGVLPDPLEERIEATFDASQPDIGGRREATAQLFDAWVERPWGVGLNESADYVPRELAEGGNPAIHNIVGNALVEGGPLAALALAVLPFVLTAMWFRARRGRASDDWRAVWSVMAMWAGFIAAQFSVSLYQHAAWIAVGAVLGVVARSPVEADAEPGGDSRRAKRA